VKVPPAACSPAARRKARQRGATIAEVVVASTLLVFVISASLSALSAGMGYARHARMVTMAGQITQSVMEQLRLNNYSRINTYAAQSQPVNFNGIISADNFSSGFTAGMNVRVAFTTQVASASGTLGKTMVQVTTTWPENGVTYTRKTMTIFTETGLSDYIYAGWSGL